MTNAMKIGRFTIDFDDEGATFTTSTPRARYRINAATATNAVDFMKHHRSLCLAMMNARPEELVAYKITEAGD